MKSYLVPLQFDGMKFATRYGLNPFKPDFYASNGLLFVPDNLPDDPPIFDPPDLVMPAPIGLYVHEMKALHNRRGNQLIDGTAATCLHIVAETEIKLSDPWLDGIFIEIGSTAYLMDKAKTVVWDGTKWK